MPVLVISNFDDDSIKNERASMEPPFSHYMYNNVAEVVCYSSVNFVIQKDIEEN